MMTSYFNENVLFPPHKKKKRESMCTYEISRCKVLISANKKIYKIWGSENIYIFDFGYDHFVDEFFLSYLLFDLDGVFMRMILINDLCPYR